MGNMPKDLWVVMHTPCHLRNRKCSVYLLNSLTRKRQKLHLMKAAKLHFWSDSFFSTGNLHLSNYQHTLNLVRSQCLSFQHPFDVYYCPYRGLCVVMTAEDFLFSRVAFVIGTGNYRKNSLNVCTVRQKQRGDWKWRNGSPLLCWWCIFFWGSQSQRVQISSP